MILKAFQNLIRQLPPIVVITLRRDVFLLTPHHAERDDYQKQVLKCPLDESLADMNQERKRGSTKLRALGCRTLVAVGLLAVGFIVWQNRQSGPVGDVTDAVRDHSKVLPVFPDAQGFGTETVAGRGGQVIRVTTLSASGPGSLAQALAASGPRVIVFEVAGIITLEKDLEISEPFVTVAGQTAPSPGISIFGAGLRIKTHDVLVRHLRIRPGDSPNGPHPENRDGISIEGDSAQSIEVYNVVVDHCSVSWAIDEGTATWHPGVRDDTTADSDGDGYTDLEERLHELAQALERK